MVKSGACQLPPQTTWLDLKSSACKFSIRQFQTSAYGSSVAHHAQSTSACGDCAACDGRPVALSWKFSALPHFVLASVRRKATVPAMGIAFVSECVQSPEISRFAAFAHGVTRRLAVNSIWA